MTKRAQLADGTVLEFPDDTPDQVVDRTVRSHIARAQQETDARTRSGDPMTPGSVGGAIAGQALQRGPQGPYQETLARRGRERAPQGRPGSFLRGLEDFNRSGPTAVIDQMMRNIGVADEVAGASEFLQSGGNAESARAGADYERGQQQRVEREQPRVNLAANIAAIPAFAGTPANTGRVSMLAAGLGAAGTNAPFALARQEGSIQERLPGAIQETAIVGGLGAGLQGVGNALTRQQPRSGQLVQNADRLGVPPNMAMTSGPLERSATRLVSENMFAGGRTRAALTRSMEGTRDASQRLANRYGRVQEPEGAGATVQRGLRRYSRDANLPNPQPNRAPLAVPTGSWSRASKARAVFDQALRPVEGNAARFNQTRVTMREILNQADSAAVRSFRKDDVIEELIDTLNNTPTPTLRDLRELRRKIRLAQDTPSLGGQTRDNANLNRLEGALTEDIYAAAGPQAAALRRADAWYRRSKQRMDGILEVLGGDDVTPQAAYNTLTRWANPRTANTRGLAAVRSALRDDEWRSFAASYINHMGQPSPGASGMVTDIGFSVANWARAYRSMTPAARRIFFGGSKGSVQNQLMQDLDDLAEIALSQKSIENMGTPSGRDVQNLVTGASALANIHLTVLGLVGMAGVGELMTSAPFVRWLTSASRAGPGAGGMRRQVSQLAQIAARDPAVVPYYEAYLTQIGEPESRAPANQRAMSE